MANDEFPYTIGCFRGTPLPSQTGACKCWDDESDRRLLISAPGSEGHFTERRRQRQLQSSYNTEAQCAPRTSTYEGRYPSESCEATLAPSRAPTARPAPNPSSAPTPVAVNNVLITHSLSGLSCSEFGEEEEASFVAAIAASSEHIETRHCGAVSCADADDDGAQRRRRRGLQASSDSVTLVTALAVPEADDDSVSVAALIASDVAAAVSSGDFAEAMSAGGSAVLARASVTGVETRTYSAPSSAPTGAVEAAEGSDGLAVLSAGGGLALVLAAAAVVLGCAIFGYLLVRRGAARRKGNPGTGQADLGSKSKQQTAKQTATQEQAPSVEVIA